MDATDGVAPPTVSPVSAAIAQPVDLALAQRAAGGDRVAQRALMQQYRAVVHRTIYRIVGTNHEVEDLLQEAFVAIFRSLGRFRGESTLTRWCCVIGTRVAWAHISRRRPITTPLDLADDVVSDEPSAWQQLALRDAVRRLYQALERVDPAQRVAFALVVSDGRPVAEVAELTGTSRVAVKTRVWRARRALMVRAKRDPVLASYLTELGDAAEPMLSEAP